jgi:hypothetical protein
MSYPFTHEINPGDALDSTELDDNFDDMFSMTDTLLNTQFRQGAVRYRNYSVAVDKYKSVQELTTAASTTSTGALTPATTFDLYDGEAALVIGQCRISGNSADPNVVLQITVGAPVVQQNQWYFEDGEIRTATIAYFYEVDDGVANYDQIRLVASAGSSGFTISNASITVIGVNR